MAEVSDLDSAPLTAMGMGSVLYENQLMTLADVQQCIHVTYPAALVDGVDNPDLGGDAPLDVGRVGQQRLRIYLAEDRRGPHVQGARVAAEIAQRRMDELVPRPQPGGKEGGGNGRVAVAGGQHVLAANEGLELLFKLPGRTLT